MFKLKIVIMLFVYLFMFTTCTYAQRYTLGIDTLHLICNTKYEECVYYDLFAIRVHSNSAPFRLILSPGENANSKIYPTAKEDSYSIRHENLSLGERFRLPGGVYEVERIDKDTDRPLEVQFKKIKEYEYSDKGVYILPISNLKSQQELKDKPHDHDSAGLHPTSVSVFSAGTQPNSGNPMLKVRVFNPRVNPASTNHVYYKSDDLGIQDIEEGKILWIADYPHKVTKIVYPDPKTKLRGWVEIEQRTEVK